MDTVATPATERPAYGTVERFAEALRKECRGLGEMRNFGCLLIEVVADRSIGTFTDGERLAYVRNALAAIDIVRAELAAAR